MEQVIESTALAADQMKVRVDAASPAHVVCSFFDHGGWAGRITVSRDTFVAGFGEPERLREYVMRFGVVLEEGR